MANHKSAKKRIRTNEKKRVRNKITSTRIKSTMKKVLGAEKIEEAEKHYKEAVALLDKSATRGRIHRNNAARKKSQLTKHVNSLQPAEKETKE
ncbi:MAG: 30S ribosomal protein S20 [Bacteroidetes bacterium]|nr:30S ribosomal protein S20 [Bacteroidota bacterium]